ncbi:MAG: phosphoserine phosphatase SerB [Erythrobacter sp.]
MSASGRADAASSGEVIVLIARLIADRSLHAMRDWEPRLDAASDALRNVDMPLASAVLLDLGIPVLEMRFAKAEQAFVIEAIERYFAPSDTLVFEGEVTLPRVFISDMDSTMIGQECIDELADFAGLKPQIAAITERAMRGELEFEPALRERVALLEGLGEAAIGRCLAERINPAPGARVLMATLKAHGARCVLVTGGFHHFADPVAETLGFDRVVGNRLEVAGGKLTGRLEGDIADADTKRRVLKEEAARLGPSARILAAGDGANDVPMLEAADYGFAVHAKPAARDAANGRIDSGDLTGMLSLLGIAKTDWTSR